MLQQFLVISSIFLTSLSAWSQTDVNPFNMGSLQDFVEASGSEVIDARTASGPLDLNLAIEEFRIKQNMQISAVELVRESLQSNGLTSRPKTFFVIQEISRGKNEYAVTMLAANSLTNSYGEVDKQLHSQVGTGIGLGSTILMRGYLEQILPYKVADNVSRIGGALLSCTAAGGKEYYDSRHPLQHTVDKKDFFATCAAGSTVLLKPIDINF